jgi:hypothetical protein
MAIRIAMAIVLILALTIGTGTMAYVLGYPMLPTIAKTSAN